MRDVERSYCKLRFASLLGRFRYPTDVGSRFATPDQSKLSLQCDPHVVSASAIAACPSEVGSSSAFKVGQQSQSLLASRGIYAPRAATLVVTGVGLTLRSITLIYQPNIPHALLLAGPHHVTIDPSQKLTSQDSVLRYLATENIPEAKVMTHLRTCEPMLLKQSHDSGDAAS